MEPIDESGLSGAFDRPEQPEPFLRGCAFAPGPDAPEAVHAWSVGEGSAGAAPPAVPARTLDRPEQDELWFLPIQAVQSAVSILSVDGPLDPAEVPLHLVWREYLAGSPIRVLASGPAGGVIGSAAFGAAKGAEADRLSTPEKELFMAATRFHLKLLELALTKGLFPRP